MKDVLFLAAFTARSQAYAQAMKTKGILPEQALLLGEEKKIFSGSVKENLLPSSSDIFLPDLSQPLSETLRDAKVPFEILPTSDINDPSILLRVKEIRPRLIIYSGYGGQIVKKNLIDNGAPLLHVHSGWVPEYRGSTTLYYSWLIEKNCGASAILLEENIDTGPIVGRKKYPTPPKGVDPDYLYDTAIRADLLIDVLKDFSTNGYFKPFPQTGSGNTYYVIHPVLKHLARLRQ